MTRIPELERQLIAAAHRRKRRRGVVATRSPSVLAGLALVFGVAAAGAATVLSQTSASPEAVEAYRPIGPVALVSQVDGPGGAPWTLRTWVRRGGDRCIQPGQADDGKFGLPFPESPGDRFVELALTDGPACGNGVAQAVRLVDRLRAPGPRFAATLIFGILPEGTHGAVEVTTASTHAEISPSTFGTWLAVLPGDVSPTTVRVSVRTGNRTDEIADFGPVAAGDDVARVVNHIQVPGEPTQWGQQIWDGADGEICTATGPLIAGAVGRFVGGLPGAFMDATRDEARCFAPPAGGAQALAVRTQPVAPGAAGNGITPGLVIVEGRVDADIESIRIDAHGLSSRAALDERTRLYLGIIPMSLDDPYAASVAERFSGRITLSYERADGDSVTRTVGGS